MSFVCLLEGSKRRQLSPLSAPWLFELKQCGYQQTHLQSIKRHRCLCAHTGGSADMARPDKQTTEVTDVFPRGPFVCVCVRACMRAYTTCMSLCWLGNYSLGIRRLAWMDGCKVLMCFNPDDGGADLSQWAPVKSAARYANRSSCCQCITFCWRYFPHIYDPEGLDPTKGLQENSRARKKNDLKHVPCILYFI